MNYENSEKLMCMKPTTNRYSKGARLNSFLLATLLVLLLKTTTLPAQVLTLDSVLMVIDKKNPMLQEYDQKAKALNTYAEGAKSWMAPMVGAGTFMTPYPGQRTMEERDKGAVMFSIEQEIPNAAKLNANRDYLQSQANVTQQDRAIQFNTLRAEAKTYYYSWIISEKKLRVLDQQEQIIETMIKLARIRYSYNQGSPGNIYKAEARLSEVHNMKLMTEAEIEDNSMRLKALLNLPATADLAIDTTTIIQFSEVQLAQDTMLLETHRSDVAQIDRSIEVMKLNRQLQKHQAKPDFKVRFDHMQPIGNMPSQFTAMAMISIPIAPWSSKMYKAEVKGMHYDIEAMKKARQGILLEKKGILTGMSRQLLRMKQQLDNYDTKIIPALKKNYQAMMIAYEENREQLAMVIDGWDALGMAQLEQLEKWQAYYMMIVQYEKEIEK